MATQVQFRRGTTGQHSAFTGAVGEVTVDTEKKTVCIHDASTIGGFPLLLEDGSNSSFSLGSLSSCALKFAGDPNTGNNKCRCRSDIISNWWICKAYNRFIWCGDNSRKCHHKWQSEFDRKF